ncbi:MAG: ATP-binding cassette domain-containing protein, partial [candidate division Zixibacteria bacterium]
MTLLSANSISKAFNDQIILENVSFTIGSTDRIGLVGKNGIGKTTLLEIIAEKQSTDSGVISRAKHCIIDYVEQEKTEYLSLSLFDFVAAARQDLLDMRSAMRELEDRLRDNPHDDASVAKLGRISNEFETAGGFAFENELKVILAGLGFEEARFSDPIRGFSGGEKNRAGLARILAGRGNLLLLDEPTNHLDIESTVWLEDYLRGLNKACIIVSHDRAFLTATVSHVWEIEFGHISNFAGGFNFYLAQRDERKRLAAHRYRHQQQEIARIEDFIRRNMAGQKTKQAKSRLKHLSRIKRLPPPQSDGRGPLLDIRSSGRSFAHVL